MVSVHGNRCIATPTTLRALLVPVITGARERNRSELGYPHVSSATLKLSETAWRSSELGHPTISSVEFASSGLSARQSMLGRRPQTHPVVGAAIGAPTRRRRERRPGSNTKQREQERTAPSTTRLAANPGKGAPFTRYDTCMRVAEANSSRMRPPHCFAHDAARNVVRLAWFRQERATRPLHARQTAHRCSQRAFHTPSNPLLFVSQHGGSDSQLL